MDGDFNVGVSNHTELMKLIAEKAKSKVFLTVMGFGMGNYRDDIIEQLANKGNGQAFYIDTILEAKKALIDEISATLNTVAKDAKLQIEFNPSLVESYRLIGYENRKLNDEDFKNDKVDAGEIGSGHQVTALYQIKLRDRSAETNGLKYQVIQNKNYADELLTLNIRYKKPTADSSIPFSKSFKNYITSTPSADWHLSASVALFGMLLRNSEHLNAGTYEMAQELAQQGMSEDKNGYRQEFLELLQTAASLNKANKN